jgi:hypothetical protein
VSEQHKSAADRVRISLLAVDTHGYTNPAMSIAKLRGFGLCPRLRELAERKLFLPRGITVSEGMKSATTPARESRLPRCHSSSVSEKALQPLQIRSECPDDLKRLKRFCSDSRIRRD